MCSESCVTRRFRRHANIVDCTYTWVVRPITHLGCKESPAAPRPQSCAARNRTKPKMESVTRRNDAVKSSGDPEMHKAAAGTPRDAVLQQAFFYTNREYTLK